ncbi:MAG TPA: hypothetical protein VK936_06305, partial [Longimicrobiales bacterium]|nr:hypothetical protein [Longimicrobiales bacterium]
MRSRRRRAGGIPACRDPCAMGIEYVRQGSQRPLRLRVLTAVLPLVVAVTSMAACVTAAGAQTPTGMFAPAFVPAVHPAPLRVPASLAGGDPALAAQEGSRRQTWRGAKIGAIAGGVAGLGVGGFIAIWCRAEGTPCDAALPIVTLGGIAGGAAGGAIIGAAIPRHADTGRAAPPVERRIGSASLSVGVVHARQEDYQGVPFVDGSGVAARVNLYAEIRP